MDTNVIVEILNAFPISKLISTVSAGIGKLYEPVHIKRMSKAKAEEIRLISGAMEECSVIPTQYNDGSLSLNNTDWDDFVRRTQGRMAFQELQKQNNIECVVANAYNILENEQTCSEEPVEQGWINRFFDSVADVSDEDLQKLWGKVLAGEIKQPRSYSLRTLETLKNLSKEEAAFFQKIASFVTNLEDDFFLVSDFQILNKYDISYDDILLLDECGLLKSHGSVSTRAKKITNNCLEICGKSDVLRITGENAKLYGINLVIFALTQTGRELYSIVDCQTNRNFLSDLGKLIQKNNSGELSITIHTTDN